MFFRGASAPRTPPRRRSLGLGASLRSGGRSRCSRFRAKTSAVGRERADIARPGRERTQ
jgi:hypothetical protein